MKVPLTGRMSSCLKQFKGICREQGNRQIGRKCLPLFLKAVTSQSLRLLSVGRKPRLVSVSLVRRKLWPGPERDLLVVRILQLLQMDDSLKTNPVYILLHTGEDLLQG